MGDKQISARDVACNHVGFAVVRQIEAIGLRILRIADVELGAVSFLAFVRVAHALGFANVTDRGITDALVSEMVDAIGKLRANVSRLTRERDEARKLHDETDEAAAMSIANVMLERTRLHDALVKARAPLATWVEFLSTLGLPRDSKPRVGPSVAEVVDALAAVDAALAPPAPPKEAEPDEVTKVDNDVLVYGIGFGFLNADGKTKHIPIDEVTFSLKDRTYRWRGRELKYPLVSGKCCLFKAPEAA